MGYTGYNETLVLSTLLTVITPTGLLLLHVGRSDRAQGAAAAATPVTPGTPATGSHNNGAKRAAATELSKQKSHKKKKPERTRVENTVLPQGWLAVEDKVRALNLAFPSVGGGIRPPQYCSAEGGGGDS